jgi:hypothetical protein
MPPILREPGCLVALNSQSKHWYRAGRASPILSNGQLTLGGSFKFFSGQNPRCFLKVPGRPFGLFFEFHLVNRLADKQFQVPRASRIERPQFLIKFLDELVQGEGFLK